MPNKILLRLTLIVIDLVAIARIIVAIGPEHAIAVTILKANLAERTFVARTLDGVERTYRFSPQAPISSLAEAAISKSLYGGEGYQFVIRYTIERKEQIVNRFDYIGREPWKSIRGVDIRKDPAANRIVLKTVEGEKIIFAPGKHCTIETARGAQDCGELVINTAQDASEVIVHYTELPTGRFAHLVEFTGPNTDSR